MPCNDEGERERNRDNINSSSRIGWTVMTRNTPVLIYPDIPQIPLGICSHLRDIFVSTAIGIARLERPVTRSPYWSVRNIVSMAIGVARPERPVIPTVTISPQARELMNRFNCYYGDENRMRPTKLACNLFDHDDDEEEEKDHEEVVVRADGTHVLAIGNDHDDDEEEDYEEVVVRADGEGCNNNAHDEVENDEQASRGEENDGGKEDGHVRRFFFWSDSFLRSEIIKQETSEWNLTVPIITTPH